MSNTDIKLCYLTLAKDKERIFNSNELWKNNFERGPHAVAPLPMSKMSIEEKIKTQQSLDVDLELEFAELAIGSILNGGDICPHRGIWSCLPAPLKGPHQRVISTGARLFNVLAEVPAQKTINRLLGRHYLAPVPTEWTLITYLPEVKLHQIDKWDIEEEWLGLAHPDLIYPIG